MAPLRALGRIWHLANDDIVIVGSAFGSALLQVARAVAFVASAHASAAFLPEQTWWMWVTAGICVLASIADLLIMWIAASGPLWDDMPRVSLPKLLELRLTYTGVELIVTALIGLQYLQYVLESTLPGTWQSTLGAAIGLQAFLLVYGLCSLRCVIPKAEELKSGSFLLRNVANREIGNLARFAGVAHRADLLVSLVSQLLGDTNATVSDIVCSIMLLKQRQDASKQSREPEKLADLQLTSDYPWGDHEDRILRRSCGGALPETKPLQDVELLKDIYHNLGFASAIYGWGAIVQVATAGDRAEFEGRLRSGAFACCRRCVSACFCGSCARTAKPDGDEDDSGRPARTVSHNINVAATRSIMKGWPGLQDADLVFYSDMNQLSEQQEDSSHKASMCPYAVILDHSKRNVVVAVRGSWSLEDAITDITCKEKEIPASEVTGPDPGPHYVHSGMWEVAMGIYNDFQDNKVLEKLFASEKQDEWLEAAKIDKRWSLADAARPEAGKPASFALPAVSDYGLMFVGHSLGAGLAVLLSALFKPIYPQVCCISYAGPAVLSEAWAKHQGGFTTAVIAGLDIVPRLGLRNMEFARDRMISLSARCPRSKFAVTMRSIFFRPNPQWYFQQKATHPKALALLEKTDRTLPGKPFFHAGQIIWLRMEKWRSCSACLCCSSERCTAEIGENEDFQEVLFDIDGLLHHHPESYKSAIQAALKQFEDTSSSGGRVTLRARGRDLELGGAPQA